MAYLCIISTVTYLLARCGKKVITKVSPFPPALLAQNWYLLYVVCDFRNPDPVEPAFVAGFQTSYGSDLT
jgi:hypothetical protein